MKISTQNNEEPEKYQGKPDNKRQRKGQEKGENGNRRMEIPCRDKGCSKRKTCNEGQHIEDKVIYDIFCKEVCKDQSLGNRKRP
jgi:hypothetical protein